jgi:hypothetical protein
MIKNIREISGLPFDDQRMAILLELYRPILREIEKLRNLELKSIYPGIYFDPTIAYSRSEAKPKA